MIMKTDVDNVYGYLKKDGTVVYRIRRLNPRTGKSEIRSVTPPEGATSGRKLTAFLNEERNKFFRELDCGLNPCTARSPFKEYFMGPYKNSFTGRPKTWYDYEALIRRHTMDWLGNVRMGEINKQTMEALLSYLSKDRGVGDSTYNATIRVLKAVFNHAMEDGIMLTNPLHGKTGKMKKVVSDTKALTPEELAAVVDAVSQQDLYWRSLYLFIIVTGCRRGEVIGLRWEDLELDAYYPCVNVNHSVEYIPGQPLLLVDTKTLNSKRKIYLPSTEVEFLKEMKEGCDTGFVFCGKDSNESILHPDSINAHTDRMCKKMNLEHFTPHTLRRTFATTLAVREKVDPKTLQNILGHADIRTLLKYYVLPDMEAKKQAIDRYMKYLEVTGRAASETD